MSGPDQRREALEALIAGQGTRRIDPPLLLPADPYFDLAGEEFGRRLLLTSVNGGPEYCLRPDFTLPIVADYIAAGAAGPAGFSYLGRIFRQRESGPAEFEQAGLELIAQPDPDAALDAVFGFARGALSVYGVERPAVRLGGVGLFEALLARLDMPDPWRPRIRHRFGHTEAMERLLARLEAPPHVSARSRTSRKALVEEIAGRMTAAGLSLSEGRTPEEIVERHLEQQALDAARMPPASIDMLRSYLAISGPASEALAAVEAFAARAGFDLSAPLASLSRHLASLPAGSRFEASFSPRLDYYTGIVFEMTGAAGTVLASGGQYDRLLERLGATAPIAAAGCALWVDRLEAEAAR